MMHIINKSSKVIKLFVNIVVILLGRYVSKMIEWLNVFNLFIVNKDLTLTDSTT